MPFYIAAATCLLCLAWIWCYKL